MVASKWRLVQYVLVVEHPCSSVLVVPPFDTGFGTGMLATVLACFVVRTIPFVPKNGLVHHASLPQAKRHGKYNNNLLRCSKGYASRNL